MSVFDHPLISDRYFFPRPGSPPQPFYVEADGARLACAQFVTDPEAPTILHFHGNGEIVADWSDFADAFASVGLNSFFAEYRGYGGSTGTPTLVEMLGDTERVLAASGLEPARVVVYGRSVGSIYAIHLAARVPSIAGLVIESGIADPLERVLMRVSPEELDTTMDALRQQATQWLDHEQKLAEFGGPTLVLHATHDHLVDVDHARRNADWSGGELVLYEQGDHNTLLAMNGAAILERVARFASANS